MECHVYYDAFESKISTFEGPPSWIGPRNVLLGTFEFDKMSEPDVVSIRDWALTRMKLLEIPPPSSFLHVSNYASHAYWKTPYS